VVRVVFVPVSIRVMVTPGTTAPVVSLTCPKMVPEVCAERLAADTAAKIHAKMQQVMDALHRLSNWKVAGAIGAPPNDSPLTGELECTRGLARHLPDAPLINLFSMIDHDLLWREQPLLILVPLVCATAAETANKERLRTT
jgi:hypothetical protein